MGNGRGDNVLEELVGRRCSSTTWPGIEHMPIEVFEPVAVSLDPVTSQSASGNTA